MRCAASRLGLLGIVALLAGSAHAQVLVSLDVSYRDCVVTAGPLSLGLDQLPNSVRAHFEFELPALPPLANTYHPTVTGAPLSLGDAAWDETQLQNFSLLFTEDEFEIVFLDGITYDFLGIQTGTAQGLITTGCLSD